MCESSQVLSGLLHALQGYGTVHFLTTEEAEKAIADFNGTDLEGRALAVKIDKCAPAIMSNAEPGNGLTWMSLPDLMSSAPWLISGISGEGSLQTMAAREPYLLALQPVICLAHCEDSHG